MRRSGLKKPFHLMRKKSLRDDCLSFQKHLILVSGLKRNCLRGWRVIKNAFSDNLSSGKSNSCGCLKAEFLARKGNQYGLYEDREKALLKVQYSHLKRRDVNKGFAETMSFEVFSRLSKSPCRYCGLDYSKEVEDRLSESKKQKRLSDCVLKCNGIDRIDSSKGYTMENSVACCKYCNTAKNTMTESEFYTWIKRVYEFNF